MGISNQKDIYIGLDILGSDIHPESEIGAIEIVLRLDEKIKIAAVCPEKTFALLPQSERISFINARSGVPMNTPPSLALRNFKGSTLDEGTKALGQMRISAFVTAGNTGAALAFAMVNIKRIRGIPRPAIAVVIPAKSGPRVLIDAGANADVRPEHLVGFAKLGISFAKDVLGVKKPKVALLNIGEEEGKGDTLRKESYKRLKILKDNFAGNIESKDLLESPHEVIVTDGFTGNICLKLLEGSVDFFARTLKDALTEGSFLTKTGAFLVKNAIKIKFEKLRYEKYGGACLLGLSRPVVIAHGRSNAEALANAILYAREVAMADIGKHISNKGEEETEIFSEKVEKETLF